MEGSDQEQENLQRMREAVDRKAEEARQKAEASRAQAAEDSLADTDRQQEQLSVRAKNTGHKKKTADKWNQ